MRLFLGASLLFFIIVAALWFFWPARNPASEKSGAFAISQMETVHIKTQDGVEIVGDYYPPIGERAVINGTSRGVLLIHMMPSDRKSWVKFAEKLQAVGFPAFAIDLRGHGESQSGPDGYKSFSDAEHQASKFDVLAAAMFLRSKKVDEFHLVGVSIGANLSLEYLSLHPNGRSAVLLSPGLDYRGIKTEPLMEKINPSRGVYLVASEDDVDSRDAVNVLAEKISLDEKHTVKIFETGGHGTTILENHPEFMDEIIGWLKQF